MSSQPGILGPVPPAARYLVFALQPGSEPGPALRSLQLLADGDGIVVGLGRSLLLALDCEIPGSRSFPASAGAGFGLPATPAALWCWLRGNDRGELVHAARRVRRAVSTAFRLEKVIDAFRYGPGLDLTGYVDGTENPEGDKAGEVAVVRGRGPGLDGSSFVAVQQWVHDLDRFESMKPAERDDIIGRRKSDNQEMDDAPASAHIKRTEQESFEPAAFVLRRSMPWADEAGEGLVFVAFGSSFDAFEALLGRMLGNEDGIPDALFSFTRPVSGSYFWCPPVAHGQLDLSALGL